MTKKKKTIIYNILEIGLITLICLFLLWLNLSHIKSRLSIDMTAELEDLDKNINDTTELNNKTDENYNLVQMHLARVAEYYLSGKKEKFSKETLAHLKKLLNAEGVFIIDSKGNILSSDGSLKQVQFFEEMYNPIKNVSEDHPVSEMVQDIYRIDQGDEDDDFSNVTGDQGTGFLPEEVENSMNDDEDDEDDEDDFATTDEQAVTEDEDDGKIRHILSFFSCYMDPGHIVVICNNDNDYRKKELVRQSSYHLISRDSYGKSGFFFKAADDGHVFFYKESPYLKNEPEEFDVPKSNLKDGFNGVLRLQNKLYFCTVKKMTQGEDYLVCALPLHELSFTVVFLCVTIVVAVLISLLLMSLYARILSGDMVGEKNDNKASTILRRRLFVLTLLCMFFTTVVGVAFHTLYSYAFTESTNARTADSLKKTIYSSYEVEIYGNDDLNRALTTFMNIAEDLISENPEYTKSKKLEELSQILGVEHILVYDKSGKVVASDRNYDGLALSKDPKDKSSEFIWVIRGDTSLIQEETDEKHLNSPYIFCGIPLTDKEGNYQGMVQLAIDPFFKANMIASTSFHAMLASYDEPGRTAVFVVDCDSKMVQSSSAEYNQQTTDDLGITKDKLMDEYAGFYHIEKDRMLGCCKTSGNNWVIVASFTNNLLIRGVQSGFRTILPAIAAELLFFLFLIIAEYKEGGLPEQKNLAFFKYAKIESEKAETHLFSTMRIAAGAAAICITIIAFLGRTIFSHGSAGYYIFVYPWSKGINIFTIARCLSFLFIVAFGLFILIRVLKLLASLLSSRQETVMRLLVSFIRYFGWLAAICFCLNLLGMPTGSLVASAGVLTCVFSIGAQSIVADILSGLFIIFEGSFKVGDMITVDDWHGEVVEIGIRNTRIKDLVTNDIKIMNNSTIKKVINFSEFPSRCPINIGIEYSMDLEELEAIIEREKPIIENNLPKSVSLFRYLGVDGFGDSSVLVRFDVTCRNQEFVPVQRALRRELKLMFDRNGINIPFTQLVLHEAKNEK